MADAPLATILERSGATLATVRSAGMLALPRAIAGVVPSGGLQRGWHVVVAGAGRRASTGAVSLALALLAASLPDDGWGVLVGLPSLGIAAVAETGVDMGRLLLVPRPGPRWAEVAAVALEGADVVLLGAPAMVGATGTVAGVVRRLRARARRAGSVLVSVQPWSAGEPAFGSGPTCPRGPACPSGVDLRDGAELVLVVEESEWELRPSLDALAWRGRDEHRAPSSELAAWWSGVPSWGRRRVTVSASGRRVGRPSRVSLWLPDGGVVDAVRAEANGPTAS